MPNQYARGAFVILAQALFLWGKVQAQSSPNATTEAKPKYNGILAYEPSKVGNGIFGIIYLILGITYSYYIHQHKNKWALCLPIGAIASSLGFFMRLTLDPANFQIMKFATQQMFVVVSPSAFLAFNYMLYGRFITAIDPKFGNDTRSGSRMEKSRFSFIPPLIVGRTFVISDITTFFVQCGAGGLQAAGGRGNPSLANLGDKLFLIGVSVQGISYLLFTLLLTVAFIRLIDDRKRNYPNQLQKGWTGLDKQTLTVVGGLYFSSAFIIIRSVYRIIEFTQGYSGYLISNEVYLFVLDAAPLVLAIGIWAFIWPTVLLGKIAAKTREGQNISAMEVGSSRIESSGNSKSDWVPLV
ncbi:hypothetical protein BGX26_009876 [Mortierella sp. AD094]|nr:hypothetical protein BGX26_009876 [Mortierella sp. AD094]